MAKCRCFFYRKDSEKRIPKSRFCGIILRTTNSSYGTSSVFTLLPVLLQLPIELIEERTEILAILGLVNRKAQALCHMDVGQGIVNE